MSAEYNEYLKTHIENVNKGFNWICSHFTDIADKLINDMWLISMHDSSKTESAEYSAYDRYFYGGNRSYEVVKKFKYAWLNHIHRNPHHWQYWVLQNDDEPEEVLDMPYFYIIEMICDWWSFSWKKDNLYEIFDWYENHKDMKLSDATRKTVESVLNRIKEELDKEKMK